MNPRAETCPHIRVALTFGALLLFACPSPPSPGGEDGGTDAGTTPVTDSGMPPAEDDGGVVSQAATRIQLGDDFSLRDDRALAAHARGFNPLTGRWTTSAAWGWTQAVEAAESSYARTNGETHGELFAAPFALVDGLQSVTTTEEAAWGNAWIRAYDLTGDARYLDTAKRFFADLAPYWSTTCGGGLWTDVDLTAKATQSTEQFLLLAAQLHNRAPGTVSGASYLDWAKRSWTYLSQSRLLSPQGVFTGGFTAACALNGQPAFTHNQGVVMGGLVELWKATGDGAYLDSAERLADATISLLVDANGVLRESCEAAGCTLEQAVYKGLFIRNLARLYAVNGKAAYREFLVRNARSVWANARGTGTRADEIGLKWAGPFDASDSSRHSSGLSALSAAAWPRTTRAWFVGNANGPFFNHAAGAPVAGGWGCDGRGCRERGVLQSGPFLESLPSGTHRAHFTMTVDAASISDVPLVTLEVYDATAGAVLATTTVRWSDFVAPNAAQDFSLEFSTIAQRAIELRVQWLAADAAPLLAVRDMSVGRFPALTVAGVERTCGQSDGWGAWTVDAWRASSRCDLTTGPGLVLRAGPQAAHFELRVDRLPLNDAPLARLSVVDRTSGDEVAAAEVSRSQLPNTLFQAVPVNFVATENHAYEFKTTWLASSGAPALSLRAVFVGRRPAEVPLTLPFNARGMGNQAGDGALDAQRNLFNAASVPATLAAFPVQFTLGPKAAAAKNTLQADGSEVSFPVGRYAELHLLGTGVQGTQAAQSFEIIYEDNTRQSVSLSFSDWSAETPQAGESVALALSSRWSSTALQYGNFRLFRYELRVDPNKAAKALKVPANANVKLFAGTLVKAE